MITVYPKSKSLRSLHPKKRGCHEKPLNPPLVEETSEGFNSSPSFETKMAMLFRKTISALVISQLVFPPSLLIAMDSSGYEGTPAASSSSSSSSSSRRASQLTSAAAASPAAAQQGTTTADVKAINPFTQKLKVLYKAQNTLPKLIEDESVPQQNMDDYYVNLEIMLEDNKGMGDKRPITLEKLFDKVEDQEATGQVLIVGGAGIGKTTLLHHMSYEWSKDHVFHDKFDAVFKVKLKKLTTKAWEKSPGDVENPLETLIYQSLLDQALELQRKGTPGIQKISKDDITHVLADQRSRVLLLLDGYDEIAHLTNSTDHIAYEIINEIFTYPNVIVTSRPNALTTQMTDRFARKIESTGLSHGSVLDYINRYFDIQAKDLSTKVAGFFSTAQGSPAMPAKLFEYFTKKKDTSSLGTLRTIHEQYDPTQMSGSGGASSSPSKISNGLGQNLDEVTSSIVRYYKDSKESLLELARRNGAIASVLTTPINAAMICLISTDPDFSRKFSGDFNIGQLYEEVIVWLGKRYESKFHGKDIKQIVADRVFELDELKALGLVAYEAFKGGQLSLPGTFIDQHARNTDEKLTLTDIIQYGLLRVDNTNASDSLMEQDHIFIHLSFQEYMMAHLLKRRLLRGTEVEILEATQFIGEHRNEPKYLMALKLMAGIVSNEQQPIASSSSPLSSQSTPLIARFWDSVTCNVDGVLELGIETKVKLLMHLLAQGKIGGRLDSRIPNLKTMMDLIDSTVLTDITQWGETIIQSGYLSRGIVERMQEIFQQPLSQSSFQAQKEEEIEAGEAAQVARFGKTLTDTDHQNLKVSYPQKLVTWSD